MIKRTNEIFISISGLLFLFLFIFNLGLIFAFQRFKIRAKRIDSNMKLGIKGGVKCSFDFPEKEGLLEFVDYMGLFANAPYVDFSLLYLGYEYVSKANIDWINRRFQYKLASLFFDFYSELKRFFDQDFENFLDSNDIPFFHHDKIRKIWEKFFRSAKTQVEVYEDFLSYQKKGKEIVLGKYFEKIDCIEKIDFSLLNKLTTAFLEENNEATENLLNDLKNERV